MTRYRHGDACVGRVSRLHNIWRGMLKRCNPNAKVPNPKYAARGIAVCETWHSYEAFKVWALANGYADDLTIERRDNDGPYAPENCAWATTAAQAGNRRNTRLVTHHGRTMHLSAWARESGIDQSLLSYRLKSGWSAERALTTKPLPKPGRPRELTK